MTKSEQLKMVRKRMKKLEGTIFYTIRRITTNDNRKMWLTENLQREKCLYLHDKQSKKHILHDMKWYSGTEIISKATHHFFHCQVNT